MMEAMDDRIDPLLSAIGERAVADLRGRIGDIYIYVEARESWLSDSLFSREHDAIHYHRAGRELGELIWELWNIPERGKRWSVMEYQMSEGQREVQFRYPEEVNVEEFDISRRERAIRRRFGEIPIVFPPWDETKGLNP